MAMPGLPLSFARTAFHQPFRIAGLCRLFTAQSRAYKSSQKTTASSGRPSNSKSPIDDYYALLLEQPFTPIAAQETVSSPPSQTSQSSEPLTTASEPEKKLDKARIIFGSKLAGPAMRQKYIEDLPSLEAAGQGTYIAGVWIPPKPTEPDNCCMSGCVNCVWDGYREELEEWVKRRTDARALAAKKHDDAVADAAGKSDDDGATSGDWSLESAMDDIPVGIREFMKTEKRLQQMRREASG